MKHETIKLTKKQQGMLWMYLHSDCVTLEGCNGAYNSASIAKHRASDYCMDDYNEHNGYRYRYCGHNCFFFTFAYLYHNTEDDNIHLRYHTHTNVYDFPVATRKDWETYRLDSLKAV